METNNVPGVVNKLVEPVGIVTVENLGEKKGESAVQKGKGSAADLFDGMVTMAGPGSKSSASVLVSDAVTPGTTIAARSVANIPIQNEQVKGLVNEIVKTNTDIDTLLADYQKAVNGELKDASGKKVDPFIVQTKLQQAMQTRLELITLLSNIEKMTHEAIMVSANNTR